MNVFDIIGPVMIGPSSSHTAGVSRIGKIAGAIFGEEINEAVITFHSTFADTYRGHGSDNAIIGGLLGFEQDDRRISKSLDLAVGAGLKYCFATAFLGDVHPNTIMLDLTGVSGKKMNLVGASTGGGNIMITKINHLDVEATCQYYTLVIQHNDKPGVISRVSGILGCNEINIAAMKVYRSFRSGNAVMVIETDERVGEKVITNIRQLHDITDVAAIATVV